MGQLKICKGFWEGSPSTPGQQVELEASQAKVEELDIQLKKKDGLIEEKDQKINLL